MTISPFYSGTQFADWQECNCCRCNKSVNVGDSGGNELPTCEIEYALMEASISDGTISDEIALRMGHDDEQVRYVWPCNEVEWSDDWKAEWQRRQEAKAQ